jgi:hypothetical protein
VLDHWENRVGRILGSDISRTPPVTLAAPTAEGSPTTYRNAKLPNIALTWHSRSLKIGTDDYF